MTDYYVLRPPNDGPANDITDFTQVEPVNISPKAKTCPKCGGPIGKLDWLPPYRVALDFYRGKPADVSWGPSNELLVSGKFVLGWNESGLQGLDGFYPVEVVKTKKRKHNTLDIPKYFAVEIKVDTADIDGKASNLIWKRKYKCDWCYNGIRKKFEGIVVREETWGGLDIFRTRILPGNIMTTARVVEFISAHEISGVRIIESKMFGWEDVRGSYEITPH